MNMNEAKACDSPLREIAASTGRLREEVEITNSLILILQDRLGPVTNEGASLTKTPETDKVRQPGSTALGRWVDDTTASVRATNDKLREITDRIEL